MTVIQEAGMLCNMSCNMSCDMLLFQGPVRCLDAAGPYVVSGGQDDQLHVYDIKVGMLGSWMCVYDT